ncbi:GGDEF domain-containing protein [Photobacterium nomapromontoriensis]|uniref:GGDEF domain-containing protein n=1 Tax=Photobacterium nomapromontoriensis TaxID=2910237 RepID=UPI003D12F171
MTGYPQIQLDHDNAFASDFGTLIHEQYKVLHVDDNLCNIFGVQSAETLLALPSLLPLFYDTDPDTAQNHYQQLIAGSIKPKIQTFRLTKPCGELVHVLAAESIVQWHNRQVIQLAIIDITEKYQGYNDLEQQAYIDSLSGLTNRNGFEKTLENELIKAEKMKVPLSCLFIDIDDFKAINDNYGHHAGDNVIRLFAQCCRNCFRQTDFIGRWGGEEFIILLPQTSLHYSLILAERLRRQVSQLNLPIAGHDISFTVSIGIRTLAHEKMSANMLVHHADLALSYAKNNGKNQVMSYSQLNKL